MFRTRSTTGLVALAVLLAGCAGPAPAPVEDGRDDAFRVAGKSDTGGVVDGTPDARGVLNLVNSAGYDLLVDEVGLSDRAAANIVNVKVGDDGLVGTADDRTFQTLQQLDDVPYVGPKVFAALLAYARIHGFVPGAPDGGTGMPDGRAGTPDSGTPDGGAPDGGTPDGSTPDGGTPDGSVGFCAITGHVRYADGSPAANVTLDFIAGAGPDAMSLTHGDGFYAVFLETVTSYTVITGLIDLPDANGRQTLTSDLSCAGPDTRDLLLTTVTLRGRVVDDQGTPVAGVAVQGGGVGGDGQPLYLNSSSTPVLTGADGAFSFQIFPGTYALELTPWSGPYQKTEVSQPIFLDTNVDLVIASGVAATGTVRLSDGTPLPDVTVAFSGAGATPWVSVDTAADGSWAASLSPDGYYTVVVGPVYLGDFHGSSIVAKGFTPSATQDFVVPAVTLRGRVVDGDGQPVAGVGVAGTAYANGEALYLNNGPAPTVTGSDGAFAFQVFPGTYSMTLTPTAPGHVTTALDLDVTVDTTQDLTID
jgi:protocatechuate 3,4-dioxygenase beta subunit